MNTLIVIFALSTLLIWLWIPSNFENLGLVLAGIFGLFLILGQPPTKSKIPATYAVQNFPEGTLDPIPVKPKQDPIPVENGNPARVFGVKKYLDLGKQ